MKPIHAKISVLPSRVLNHKSLSPRFFFCTALLVLALGMTAFASPPGTLPVRRALPIPEAELRGLQFEALPLERSRQNHLLVRATINGKPALLGVDSGAPVSAISIARLRYFGMVPVRADSEIPTRLQINGTYNNVAIARSLRLGTLNLIDEPMVAVDLGSSSKAAKLMSEQAIDGILGADILFPTQAVLDCRAQMLILKVDPKVRGSAPGLDFTGFQGVPIHVSPGYNLYVDGRLNGKRAKLMVDTGAFATLLHQPFVRRMNIPMRESPFRSEGVNFSQRGVQFATISRFSIGSVNMRDKKVGVIDLGGLILDHLLDSSPPVAGLLGSEILRRHSGIIDFGTKTLYLKL